MPGSSRHPPGGKTRFLSLLSCAGGTVDPGTRCLDRRQDGREFGDMVNTSCHRLGQVDLTQPVVSVTDVEPAIDVGCT